MTTQTPPPTPDPLKSGYPGAATTAERAPNFTFMRQHLAHLVALGFGSGLSPKAPGTAGTLFAWLIFVLLAPWMSNWAWGITIAAALPIGLWACKRTANALHTSDPGAIVWDEVVAFWLVLWLIMPANFWAQLIAFLLFRFFDMLKPGPVRWADHAFKGPGYRGAFGIMFDDLVAAFLTLLVIAIGHFISELF